MEDSKRIDMLNFIAVMVLFTTGMIIMIVNNMENPWGWIIYIIAWSWVEIRIARNLRLEWWGWLLIISCISLIGLTIIYYMK